MIREVTFTKDELLAEIEELGKVLSKPVSVFMMGGCAMSLRGDKESTRDVDWVVENKEDMKILVEALKNRFLC